MTEHKLKTLPEFFRAAKNNTKPFELRKDDRDFQVGDILVLEEYEKGYTGQVLRRRITYILRGVSEYGLMDGFCILGIDKVSQAQTSFDAPENCVICPMGHSNSVGDGIVCKAANKTFKEAYLQQDIRAPFCPLEIK